MKYDDRLQFELSKVSVILTIKMKSFVISDKLEKGFIPTSIRLLINEITKVKMMLEYEYYKNEEVRNSIPEIDSEIVSFEIVKEIVQGDGGINEVPLNMDQILDKIVEDGIDSLSDEEKEFLDKKSKE